MPDPAEQAPRCPLPAVGRWTWYPEGAEPSSRPSKLPGVCFCRLHEAAARPITQAKVPAADHYGPHYLHRDHYDDRQDRVRCEASALYDRPVADLDATRLAALLDQACDTVHQITHLTTCAWGAIAVVGNEDAVLEALVGLAVDVAASVDVVQSRIEGRTRIHTVDDGRDHDAFAQGWYCGQPAVSIWRWYPPDAEDSVVPVCLEHEHSVRAALTQIGPVSSEGRHHLQRDEVDEGGRRCRYTHPLRQ